MTTLQKVYIAVLAACWLGSAAYSDSDQSSAAAGASIALQEESPPAAAQEDDERLQSETRLTDSYR